MGGGHCVGIDYRPVYKQTQKESLQGRLFRHGIRNYSCQIKQSRDFTKRRRYPKTVIYLYDMNAIDEYDIRQAFDALDDHCQGRLDFAQLQTLYLGLGFSVPRRRMTEQHLCSDAQRLGLYQDSLSLHETLKLFRKVRMNEEKRTSNSVYTVSLSKLELV